MLETIQGMLDYVYLGGAILLGVTVLMWLVRLVYRRGIAILLSLILTIDVSIVGIAAFALGKEGTTLLGLAIVMVVLIPIGVASVLVIARRVINPAREMAAVADGISKGELDQVITVEGNDELGDMAAAFTRMIAYLQAMASVAERVSRGDLTGLVIPQSDRDVLGNAMVKMKDSVSAMVSDANMMAEAADEGRLDTRADAARHQGDFRRIVEGMNNALDAVIMPMQAASEILANVAHGDLTVETNGNYHGDYAILSNSIESMVSDLRGITSQIQEGSVNISSAIAEIMASSSQMASATREQAGAISQVTSTVEEIRVSARQVADRAQSMADGAARAAQAAQRGSEASGETIASMYDIRQKVESIAGSILSLSEQMQQIGNIIDTVTDIADQSNILALNAAIEAAQAGEAGKGFRVVADEVRRLAEQSRQAAAQVRVILGDIQQATNQAVMAMEQGTKGTDAGTELINRTAQAIRELAQVVQESSQAAQQIVAGVHQQTIGLDQIAAGMDDINQAAQQSAASAQQSQKAVMDLNELAAMFKEIVTQYRV